MIRCLRGLARDRHRLILTLRYGSDLSEADSEFVRLVLAAEDKRYWSHSGIDWIAVARATFWRAVGMPKGGASTIEMQFVRTVTHRRERSVRRKIREMILASMIGQFASKREIISTYLRVAYFGHNQTGPERAALFLFRSSVADACVARKACLAALLVWPLPRSRSLIWYGRIFRRARWIMSRIERIPYL